MRDRYMEKFQEGVREGLKKKEEKLPIIPDIVEVIMVSYDTGDVDDLEDLNPTYSENVSLSRLGDVWIIQAWAVNPDRREYQRPEYFLEESYARERFSSWAEKLRRAWTPEEDNNSSSSLGELLTWIKIGSAFSDPE